MDIIRVTLKSLFELVLKRFYDVSHVVFFSHTLFGFLSMNEWMNLFDNTIQRFSFIVVPYIQLRVFFFWMVLCVFQQQAYGFFQQLLLCANCQIGQNISSPCTDAIIAPGCLQSHPHTESKHFPFPNEYANTIIIAVTLRSTTSHFLCGRDGTGKTNISILQYH